MPIDTAPEAPAPLSLDLSDESATTALYRAAIGPVGASHYLPVFARFETADRAGSGWNWAACLCTLGWMLFRRMWSAALAYTAAVAGTALVAAVLMGLVLEVPPQVQVGIGLALVLLAYVVPGLWGDAWLYAHSRKRMAAALAQSTSWTEAAALLEPQAPDRRRAWWLALACAVVLGGGLAAYRALPGGPDGLVGGPPALVEAPGLPASAPASSATATATATAAVVSAPVPVADPAPASSSPAPALVAAVGVASAASASEAAAVVAPPPAPAVSSAPAAAIAAREHSPVETRAPRPVSKPAAVPADAVAGAYYVNVGLFAVESNARKARDKLRGAGVKVELHVLQMKNGPRTRVRAGPYKTQAQADAAAGQIRALGLDAVLFRQAPAQRP